MGSYLGSTPNAETLLVIPDPQEPIDSIVADALSAAVAGDHIRIPLGSYVLQEPIVMKSGVTITGSGDSGTTLTILPKAAGSNRNNIIDFSSANGAELKNIIIDGGNFADVMAAVTGDGPTGGNILDSVTIQNVAGQDAYESGPMGVLFVDQPGNIIRNCTFQHIHKASGEGSGIGLYGGPYIVDSNNITDVGRNGLFALRFSGKIINNIIDDTGTGALPGDTGLSIELHPGDNEGGAIGAVVANNTVDSWISVVSGVRCAIRHNIIGNNRNDERYCGIEVSGIDMVAAYNATGNGVHTGIIIERPSEYVSTHDNEIENPYTEGIAFIGVRTDDPSDFVLRNVMIAKTSLSGVRETPPNSISSVPAGTGIELGRSATNVTIVDSSVTDNDAVGIALYDEAGDTGPDNIFIVGNDLSGNGQGGIGVFGHSAMAGRHIAIDGNTGIDNTQPGQSVSIPYEQFNLNINTSTNNPVIGAAVEFSISGLPQNVDHILWDFDEGEPVAGSNVSKVFTDAGVHNITATVWLSTGQSVLVQSQVTI